MNAYNISQWGDGFFAVDGAGELIAKPDRKNTVNLNQLIKEHSLSLPILVRFTDILISRVQDLYQAFSTVKQQFNYQGQYQLAYPIKVNQQKHVVETLFQQGIGLEAGSKPELMAVLSLATKPGALIICNGYKDKDYIRLALIAQQLGHRVYIIIEKASELKLILKQADIMQIKPKLGIRVRLSSIGEGNWQNTGGAKAKFGLHADQVLSVIDNLKQTNKLTYLQVLHFHMGSQIANLKHIKAGMNEAAQFYVQLIKLGVPIDTIDIGGGLGVDYEGTRSRSFHSMNYNLQQYAETIISQLQQLCDQHQLKHPNIISESGRAVTAHHAVLITNIIDYEKTLTAESSIDLDENNLHETYEEAKNTLSDAEQAFANGSLDLQQRANAEQLFNQTCGKIRELLQLKYRKHREYGY